MSDFIYQPAGCHGGSGTLSLPGNTGKVTCRLNRHRPGFAQFPHQNLRRKSAPSLSANTPWCPAVRESVLTSVEGWATVLWPGSVRTGLEKSQAKENRRG